MVNDAVRGGGRKNRGHLLLTSPGVWESRVSSKPLVLGLNLPLGLPLHFWKRKPLLSLMPISRGYFGLLLVPVPIFNCPGHPRTHSTRSKEELLCPPPAPTLRRRVFRKCDFCSKGSGGGRGGGDIVTKEGHMYIDGGTQLYECGHIFEHETNVPAQECARPEDFYLKWRRG